MGIVHAKVGVVCNITFCNFFNITTTFQANENITEASEFSPKNFSRQVPEKEDIKEIELDGVRVNYTDFALKYLITLVEF